MVEQKTELISDELLDQYITQAAKTANYEKGFGIDCCDLSIPVWWAAYCRQSLDQQSQNNRVPEYLLTLAKMAKEQGVVVPREYIFYDHETGEHLDRPAMSFLRHELIEKQKITGVLFADLRCLSREPAPQQVFERICELLGVKLIFGDAPSGMDVGSQFARSALTFSNKLARLATNRNARAGNIGRVLKGWVPAHKAPYGYVYRRDAEITTGKIQIKKAWWEIDQADADGKPMAGSAADTIIKIFNWIGNEHRTLYWVAKKLQEAGIKGPGGGIWVPNSLRRVLISHSYTGKSKYNANARVPNPKRPLGDVTGAVKRTLIRAKPAGEAVEFNIPPIITEDLWQKANQVLRERGRGRGKEGKAINALLRNRIFCPRCIKPLLVRRRKNNDNRHYYYCSRSQHALSGPPCSYRLYVQGIWDESVWDCVCLLLKQDSFVEEQLTKAEQQSHDIDKLIKLEQQKTIQYQTKIDKIREGFEGGLYSLEEAKSKVNNYQAAIVSIKQEIDRVKGQGESYTNIITVDELRKELQELSSINLDQASFNERRDIINKLDIKVYPSEDLKTMKIRCSVNPGNGNKSISKNECGIVLLGSTGSP